MASQLNSESEERLGESIYSNVIGYCISSMQRALTCCEEKDRVPKGKMVKVYEQTPDRRGKANDQ